MRAGVLLLAWLAIGCGSARFPHRLHLETKSCGAPSQPPCPTCASCHATERGKTLRTPQSRCASCHESNVSWRREPEPMPRAPVRFDHFDHLALEVIRGQCVKCHAGVVDGNATRMPQMASCFDGCHGSVADSDCKSCHPTDLRRLVPRTFLRHDMEFARNHGAAAASQERVCSRCHAAGECVDCHDASQKLPVDVRRAEQIDRELLHRADFVSRHGIEARHDGASCLRCHQTSSCDGCHVLRGVSASLVRAASPHPVGWIGPDVGGANFHGRHARREIVTCAGCHDQGPMTNCIRCHKVGGSGGNPHPSGWRSSRDASAATCRYCHER